MMHIKIKELRESHGFTQQQVADVLNIEITTYTYYEPWRIFPSISIIIKLSELYSVPCDYLMKSDIKQTNSVDAYDFLNSICKKECELLCYFRMGPTNVQNKIMGAMKTVVKKLDYKDVWKYYFVD